MPKSVHFYKLYRNFLSCAVFLHIIFRNCVNAVFKYSFYRYYFFPMTRTFLDLAHFSFQHFICTTILSYGACKPEQTQKDLLNKVGSGATVFFMTYKYFLIVVSKLMKTGSRRGIRTYGHRCVTHQILQKCFVCTYLLRY